MVILNISCFLLVARKHPVSATFLPLLGYGDILLHMLDVAALNGVL